MDGYFRFCLAYEADLTRCVVKYMLGVCLVPSSIIFLFICKLNCKSSRLEIIYMLFILILLLLHGFLCDFLTAISC